MSGAGIGAGRWVRSGACTVGCGACCRHLRLQVPPAYATPDIRRWIELHGLELQEVGGATFVLVRVACQALTPQGLCALWGTPERPDLCTHYPATPEALYGIEECTYAFEAGKPVGSGASVS